MRVIPRKAQLPVESWPAPCDTYPDTRPKHGPDVSRTLRHQLLVAALAASIAGGLAWPAKQVSAFEIFGIRLFGSDTPPAGGYALTIDEGSLTKALLRDVRAASTLWARRRSALGEGDNLLTMANADYRAILASLYANGYYSPQISITLNGREAADIPFDAEIGSGADVAVSVIPGPAFSFGAVSIGPLAPPAQRRNDRVEAPGSTGLVAGAPARAGAIGDATDLAIEAWRQQGHPLASVAARSITADHARSEMDARATIDPGPTAGYGPVTFGGQTQTHDHFLALMTRLPENALFDPDDLEAMRARLLRLGVFSSVRIEEATALDENGQLPINVSLRELPLRRVGVGLTLSSVDGFGAEAFWFHRNLFGHGERLRFDAAISGLGLGVDFSAADYAIGAAFTRPGVLLPDLNFVMEFTAERETTSGFVTRNAEYQIGFQYRTGPFSADAAGFAAYSDIDDGIGFQRYNMLGLHLGARYDRRDSELDPRRGFYLETELTPFWEYQSGQGGLAAVLEGRGYIPLGADEKFVLAGRARIGSLMGFDASNAPANMLFLSGGGNSVRGYGYNSRGIGSGTSLAGGLSLINLSVEARWAVSETLGLVAFADAGLVGSTALPGETGEWHTGIGLGLRYQTGLGPLRVDIARGLNRQSGDPEVALYIGLGQAF